MNAPVRSFEAIAATRTHVPLLVGLMGPSGSGKTWSSLRLATGIQRVTGGDIYVIDTESRRALHYADSFKFKHIEFKAPFGSLDYLEVVRFAVKEGAKVIVVDSMSHEHEGDGGYLDTHAAEVARMSGGDAGKAERVKMAGWIKASALRRKMINGLLQMNANFIFCFRAKEKTKPKQGGGIQEMGFMPIAGEEMLFEQTVNCLLPPKSNGVPQWRSDMVGERLMMKLPNQFKEIFADNRALDEAHGQALAEWARGGKSLVVDGATRKGALDGGTTQIGTGATEVRTSTTKPKGKTPREFVDEAKVVVAAFKKMNGLNDWLKANEAKLSRLTRETPDLAKELQDVINEATDRLNVLAAG